MIELLDFILTLPRTWARSEGPILQAHPAPWLNVLSLILSLPFIFENYSIFILYCIKSIILKISILSFDILQHMVNYESLLGYKYILSTKEQIK